MRFRERAAEALRDEDFLREIQQAANRAAADGIGSEAWIELANYFAENENELSLLVPSINDATPGVLNTDANTTNLLATQTGMTGTTTTTTTTSRLCTLPGICPRVEVASTDAREAGAAKTARNKRR